MSSCANFVCLESNLSSLGGEYDFATKSNIRIALYLTINVAATSLHFFFSLKDRGVQLSSFQC